MPFRASLAFICPIHLHSPGLSALLWANGLVAWRRWINVGHLLRASADSGVEGGRIVVQAQTQQRGEQKRQNEGGPGNVGQARRGNHGSLPFFTGRAFPSLCAIETTKPRLEQR